MRSGWLLMLGGFFGLLGVILSARATHGGDGPQLLIAAQFLLFHAPIFVALAAPGLHALAPRLAGLVAALLALGLALFCGDLAVRAFFSRPILPFVAPAGGFLLIAGWFTLFATGLKLAITPKR